jgi:hypothetical protein
MFDDLDPTALLPEEERRRGGRSRLFIRIFFEGAGATGVASTRDISAGGLYMNTPAILPVGAAVVLRIPLGAVQVVADARVIYSNPGRGVGVHFYGLSERVRAMLERAGSADRLAA